jgi:hypothetical protein
MAREERPITRHIIGIEKGKVEIDEPTAADLCLYSENFMQITYCSLIS